MKKKVFLASIILLIGIIFPIIQTQADSGWDSSYSGGSSWSSSDSGWSSSYDSDWSSSDSSWSSSSSSGNNINWSTKEWNDGTSSERATMIADLLMIFLPITFMYWTLIFVPIGRTFGNFKNFERIPVYLMIIRIGITVLFLMIDQAELFFIIDTILCFVFVFIIVPLGATLTKDTVSTNKKIRYIHTNPKKDKANNEKLKELGMEDMDSLKQEFYQKYVDIQNAWMNIEYEKLKPLLTNSLYNMYKSQLKILELKNQKNIMSDFEYIDCKLLKLSQIHNKLQMEIYLNVKMYDYVVDQNNIVIKGNKNKKINIGYRIIFEKNISDNLNTCSNCGATMTNNTTNECEYCNSVIIKESNEWVMSKKICIYQR